MSDKRETRRIVAAEADDTKRPKRTVRMTRPPAGAADMSPEEKERAIKKIAESLLGKKAAEDRTESD